MPIHEEEKKVDSSDIKESESDKLDPNDTLQIDPEIPSIYLYFNSTESKIDTHRRK